MRRSTVVLVSLLMTLAGCATPRQPVAHSNLPHKAADAVLCEQQIRSWQARGLQTEAQYQQIAGKPTDRIDWKFLEVWLPTDDKHTRQVAAEVGNFAARASNPVQIVVYVKSREHDALVMAGIKEGASASGARNKARVEHVINGRYQPMIQVRYQEEK